MTTVYDAHREQCERLAKNGRTAVAEIAKHFDLPAKIDRALGLHGAAAHWYSGRNGVSNIAEAACQQWLNANVRKAEIAAPADLLLVTCPPGAAAKAAKVLAVLGCEVVEV